MWSKPYKGVLHHSDVIQRLTVHCASFTPERDNTISIATFHDILARYASKVPDALINLDVLRYSTIPSNLEARGTGKDRYLTKDEVVSLVEWKL